MQDAWNEKLEREEDEFNEEQRTNFVKEMDPSSPTKQERDNDTISCDSPSKQGLGFGIMLMSGLDSNNPEGEGLKKMSAKAKLRLAMKKAKENEKSWANSDKRKKLVEKIKKVCQYFAKCKEHIAHITIHIITMLYDENLTTIFPTYIYKNLSFVSEDAEKERMVSDCQVDFPFFSPSYKNTLLEITYTFLSEIHYIDQIKISNPGSRAAVEKLFMYVSTAERDCFLNSMRMVTASDTKFFENNVRESIKTCEHVLMMRNSIIILLDHMANRGFNKYGVIVRPLGENDPNFDRVNLWNPKYSKVKQGLFASFEASKVKDKSGVHDETIKVGDNIFDMLNILINDLKLLTNEKDVCVSLTRQAVPLLVLALLDYLTDYLQDLYTDASNGLNFSINTNIRHQIEDCSTTFFDVLVQICEDNNLAKAQIFKGDGAFHLINLLKKQDICTAIFMLKITKEINIGAYITSSFYKQIQQVYEEI